MLHARFGGWLHGASAFDASLFNLTASEVELMDPQQRLLLEVSWEAIQTSHQQLVLAGKLPGWGADGDIVAPP